MFDPALIDIATLPHVGLAARRDLPRCQGIYFVSTPEEVLYIGRAKNLNSRWIDHHRAGDLIKLEHVTVSWLAFDGPAELLAAIETACIEYFNPALNGSARPASIGTYERIQIVIPKDVLELIENVKQRERRNRSNMIVVLVDEALRARDRLLQHPQEAR